MYPAAAQYIPEGVLAANVLLREKLHQGFESGKAALHQGGAGANCTALLGVAGAVALNSRRSKQFHLNNWLGTRRITVDAQGNYLKYFKSLPFGEMVPFEGSTGVTDEFFTGKPRDRETGNDDFGSRHYASTMGRWLQPDPLNLTNERLENPSNTLNKYAYAANNPLKYIDKDGKDITIFYRAPQGLFDTGHIFIGAVNTENGSAAFLNFHPTGNELYGPGTFQNNLQALGANGINNAYASLTIQTNPGPETQKIVDLINKINAGEAPNYFLLGTNCTTVCQDALHDVGLDFGDISPQSFWQHAFIKFSPEMQSNPFKAFFPPSAPGHDYGDPRYGMNYSSLLWNLMFDQHEDDNATVTVSQCDTYPDGSQHCR
ncbi:MAG: RHS repeat-associated core domain-containing protein [Acidobacteriaceae bacterium]|nr:RHS repeat-associated core domain-containing protein [Acidobacteriaceae bacterium]